MILLLNYQLLCFIVNSIVNQYKLVVNIVDYWGRREVQVAMSTNGSSDSDEGSREEK